MILTFSFLQTAESLPSAVAITDYSWALRTTSLNASTTARASPICGWDYKRLVPSSLPASVSATTSADSIGIMSHPSASATGSDSTTASGPRSQSGIIILAISICLGVLAVIVFVLMVMILRRRKRRKMTDTDAAATGVPELDGDSPMEHKAPSELPGRHEAVELPGEEAAAEMEAASPDITPAGPMECSAEGAHTKD